MSRLTLELSDLRRMLLADAPWIDVRAPVEFAQGHLPGAVNLPLLNDEERALIGLTYKKEGSEAAVQLGYQLISGEVKDQRVQKWKSFLHDHPRAGIYCFRGGQRSRISQGWIADAGVRVPLLSGGYKFARNFLLDQIEDFSVRRELLILSGPTGSGKTNFLNQVNGFMCTLDLENLAAHRGSAFGSMTLPQPTQINFENALALALLKMDSRDSAGEILVEDESRLIGRSAIPNIFFQKMRASEVVWLEASFESRVQNIYREYILSTALVDGTPAQAQAVFEKYKDSVRAITRKLGGLRAQEILALIEKSEEKFRASKDLETNREWIARLLSDYYDPLYHNSLERRKVRIAFRGDHDACAEFLRSRTKNSRKIN